MSPSWRSMATFASAAFSRASESIADEESIPMTGLPVRRAIGIEIRPVPTASSTTGPSASAARPT